VQLAENNQFVNEPDNSMPSIIYYTNLQNIENQHGEGERSFAIMEMNTRYPLSFLGMTLPKDSEFHMMGGKYADGQWKKVENVTWTNATDFGKELLAKFTAEKCFQYGERTVGETGNGIYLPRSKPFWERALKMIVEQANTHFSEQNVKGEDAAKLRGAYQEYVYTMIQAYMEMGLTKFVYDRSGNKTPLLTAIRACKENRPWRG